MPRAAVRLVLHGQGAGLPAVTVARAGELGVLGWVREDDDGKLRVHAEGERAAVDALVAFLRDGADAVEVEAARVEGHEQFAVRGVPAGGFAVLERDGYELRLEVAGGVRAWTVPKGPSLDPAAKRFAVALDGADALVEEGVAVWDRGLYEQGGRVPWPEAIDRGHAVFVLHGERLRGGFALQRTRGGARPGWLLVKRRDAEARTS